MKFATSNKNKLREAQQITGISFESLVIDLPEIQAINVIEVIEEKAKVAYKFAGEPVLVEDTGLSIEVWGGLPGALIKWFMKAIGNEGILKMMSSESNRSATVTTHLAYFDGVATHTFSGSIKGEIPESIKGESGFGWDPIFIPEGSTKTFAEMTMFEKNIFSHRKKAIEKLTAYLKSNPCF